MRGRDCKTYYDAITDWATPNPTLVGKIINESVDPEGDVASGGSRESEYEDNDVTQLRLNWSGTYRYQKNPTTNDTVFTDLQTAFLANTPLMMFFLDDAFATVGAEGWRAPMKLTKMPQKRDLGDMVEISLEGKSCLYDDGGTLREPEPYVVAAP